jgi:uncharacterized protein (DUF1778 family)
MKEISNPPARARRLNIRLSQQEWNFIQGLAANSTCRSTSEYARKVLAQKPVKVLYRNQSFDEFEEQMTTRFLPLLEQFKERTERLTAEDPVALAALQSLGTIFHDIRSLLAKLSDQCAQK